MGSVQPSSTVHGLIATELLTSNSSWTSYQRALLVTASSARTTPRFASALARLAATLRDPVQRTSILLNCIEFSVENRNWGRLRALLERCERAVRSLVSHSSLSRQARGYMFRARLLQAYYTGHHDTARALAKRLRRVGGYFEHVSRTYEGLLELDRGDTESARAYLLGSIQCEVDDLLKARGYSSLLLGRLEQVTPHAPEIATFRRIRETRKLGVT